MAMLLILFIAGCAGRSGSELLATVTSPPVAGARTVRVYVATTRDRAAPDSTRFTDQLSLKTNYASFDVSVPPGHRPGEIEWPGRAPDPAVSFAVRDQRALDENAFLSTIAAAAAEGDAGILVHGYNTSFEEALFRISQMAVDVKIAGMPILFAWPSQNAFAGYLTDKEAVTASRDNLANLLVQVVERRGTKNTAVFAHSMGAWLLMEALRQLKLQGRDNVLDRLRVFLAAPDIGEDVFQAQLAVIGEMRIPITVFVSRDDVALRLASFLSGNGRRIGALDVSSPAIVEAARRSSLQIVDISQLDARDRLNHDRYAALAGLQRKSADYRGRRLFLNQAGVFVLDRASTSVSAKP